MHTWEGEKEGEQSRESKGCRHGRAPAWTGEKGEVQECEGYRHRQKEWKGCKGYRQEKREGCKGCKQKEREGCKRCRQEEREGYEGCRQEKREGHKGCKYRQECK